MNVLEHEARRKIVELLREGERSAGELSERLGRRRPVTSHHLSLLLDAGVVHRRPSGALRLYRLDEAKAVAAWDDYVGAAGSPRESAG
jgi:DNA-binding transcriptional ArsR family regulator